MTRCPKCGKESAEESIYDGGICEECWHKMIHLDEVREYYWPIA